MTRSQDQYSWTTVRLPERDLAEVVLDFASPLLTKLGATPPLDDARSSLTLAIDFWNASVLASKLWERPRVKELNELKKRLHGRQASRQDAQPTIFSQSAGENTGSIRGSSKAGLTTPMSRVCGG